MSRIYDALQQCIPTNEGAGLAEEQGTDALFRKQFEDSAWDLDSTPQVQLNLSREDKLPALLCVNSFAFEQFRLLGTRMQHLREFRPLKTILLTSSVAEEGKTLLSVNLAMSLAHGGRQKVLLLEADLRKPSLCRTLGLSDFEGLKEWFRSDRPMNTFLRRISGLQVWVLAAGLEPVDPLELINSARTASLLADAAAAFDWVLIDSSPLLPTADSGLVSRVTDGTVLVVRRDRTSKSALKQGLERVESSKLLGLLLNDFPTTEDYGYERYGVVPAASTPIVNLASPAA
jgi:capsular exopolysaccharide synthesis family protein